MNANERLGRSTARRPRGIVRVDGVPLSGWLDWEVTSNVYREADTFRVSFALSSLPSARSADYFLTRASIAIEILVGFPPDPDHPSAAELDSLIYGMVDDVEVDPLYGLLTLTGRDLTASLIDAQIDKEFSNTTSSYIAAFLATSELLTPIITPTHAAVGTFYKHDQVVLHANGSKWDLLCKLADQEGFVCYVTGNELHFEPDTRDQSDPYPINWQPSSSASGAPACNATHLSFSRSMQVERGAVVTVSAASLRTKSAVRESWPPATQQAGSTALRYNRTMPAGTDSVTCLRVAKAMYAQITSHAMKLRACLPGDTTLSTNRLVRVEGTGTALDQLYVPMQIRRRMSVDDGYVMELDAQNHSSDLAPTEPVLQGAS